MHGKKDVKTGPLPVSCRFKLGSAGSVKFGDWQSCRDDTFVIVISVEFARFLGAVLFLNDDNTPTFSVVS